jgi:hypothetical protein
MTIALYILAKPTQKIPTQKRKTLGWSLGLFKKERNFNTPVLCG